MKRETLRKRGTGKAAIKAARIAMKRDRAALEADLSVPMVTWARRVLTLGTPELIKAVEDGVVSVKIAARVCRWSSRAQREILLSGKKLLLEDVCKAR
jgi:hypothetical protein